MRSFLTGKRSILFLVICLLLIALPVTVTSLSQQQIIKQHAATSTTLGLTLFIHGLGKGGDSANPNGGGNSSLIHTQRTVTVEVWDLNNTPVLSNVQGVVTFDAASGSFKGTVNLGSTLLSDAYVIKIKTPQSLRMSLARKLTAGIQNDFPTSTLISGDINNDNQLNVDDYNILLNCYSDFAPAQNCTATLKAQADLNDDNNVNQIDYNFFIRELTNRLGDNTTPAPTSSVPTSTPTRAPTSTQPTPTKTPTPTPTPIASSGTCNLNATTANFASQVSAATAGQIVCLASGNYGTWSGTNKAITVKAASGAAPQMKISFGSGASGFTLDGMQGMGGSVTGSASNITVKNSQFTSEIAITGTGTGIVFDGNTHNNISGSSTANRFLALGPVTIKNSHFEGGGSDGVRLATSATVNVLNNTFLNINADGSGNHTDMIQWYGGSNAVVRGNFFKQTIAGETQVMGAFDGTGGNLIEDNVVDVTGRNWGIELYSDDGSIIRHNTVVYHPASPCDYNLPCGIIDLNHKDVDDAGRNTQVYDNVATSVVLDNGSTASKRDHNMVRQSVASGDFTGIPVFAGGSNPSTYDGYRLAAGSPGKNAASDGKDVGIR